MGNKDPAYPLLSLSSSAARIVSKSACELSSLALGGEGFKKPTEGGCAVATFADATARVNRTEMTQAHRDIVVENL